MLSPRSLGGPQGLVLALPVSHSACKLNVVVDPLWHTSVLYSKTFVDSAQSFTGRLQDSTAGQFLGDDRVVNFFFLVEIPPMALRFFRSRSIV